MSKPRIPIQKSFDRYVEKLGNESGCWIWTGGTTYGGYGVFHPQRGVEFGAHRFAAKQAGMDIEGKQVCHKCDTPSCVNPNHLFVSDQMGNIQDKVSKNRQAKGEKNGGSKLKETEVLEILSAYERGETQVSLSRKYKMSKYAIWRIVEGDGWAYLKNNITNQ